MYNPQTLENIWIFSTFKRNHETTLDTGEAGVEPALTVLETAFLPLEDSPTCVRSRADFAIISHHIPAVNKNCAFLTA